MKEILALFIAGFYCFAQPQDIDKKPYYYFWKSEGNTTITIWVNNDEFHRFMEQWESQVGYWDYVLPDEAMQILYKYNDRIIKGKYETLD